MAVGDDLLVAVVGARERQGGRARGGRVVARRRAADLDSEAADRIAGPHLDGGPQCAGPEVGHSAPRSDAPDSVAAVAAVGAGAGRWSFKPLRSSSLSAA